MINKLKNYWWLFTTLATILLSIISCTIVVAEFYYNIENQYNKLLLSVESNKQMSLKSVIWNSEIPIGEQISACDVYIDSGFNSLTKKHCEYLVANYDKLREVIE